MWIISFKIAYGCLDFVLNFVLALSCPDLNKKKAMTQPVSVLQEYVSPTLPWITYRSSSPPQNTHISSWCSIKSTLLILDWTLAQSEGELIECKGNYLPLECAWLIPCKGIITSITRENVLVQSSTNLVHASVLFILETANGILTNGKCLLKI